MGKLKTDISFAPGHDCPSGSSPPIYEDALTRSNFDAYRGPGPRCAREGTARRRHYDQGHNPPSPNELRDVPLRVRRELVLSALVPRGPSVLSRSWKLMGDSAPVGDELADHRAGDRWPDSGMWSCLSLPPARGSLPGAAWAWAPTSGAGSGTTDSPRSVGMSGALPAGHRSYRARRTPHARVRPGRRPAIRNNLIRKDRNSFSLRSLVFRIRPPLIHHAACCSPPARLLAASSPESPRCCWNKMEQVFVI